MSLSDKITNEVFNETHILTKDVKEFIQKLKKIKIDILEATGRLSREYMIECYEKEIDKLAGDKLTENST